MELYNFKEDLAGSVFRLMGRIILIAILVQVLVSLVSYVLIMFGAPEIHQLGQEMEAIAQNSGDPEQMFEDLRSLFIGNDAINYGAISSIGMISMILSLITYNILYNGARNEITSGDNGLSSAFSGIFDVRILKYFIINIILVLGLSVIMFLLIATQIWVLVIIASLIILPIYVWFGISSSAIGLDNVSVGNALSISMKSLTIGRWAKTFGIGILVVIVVVIVSLIGQGIGSLFGFIPGIGDLLNQIVTAAVSGVIGAFFIAGFTGLYYRYTGRLEEDEYIVTD